MKTSEFSIPEPDRKYTWSNIKYNNHCDVVRVCIDRSEILIQICMPALELIVATHMQFCNGGSLVHSKAWGAQQIPHSNVDTPVFRKYFRGKEHRDFMRNTIVEVLLLVVAGSSSLWPRLWLLRGAACSAQHINQLQKLLHHQMKLDLAFLVKTKARKSGLSTNIIGSPDFASL